MYQCIEGEEMSHQTGVPADPCTWLQAQARTLCASCCWRAHGAAACPCPHLPLDSATAAETVAEAVAAAVTSQREAAAALRCCA